MTDKCARANVELLISNQLYILGIKHLNYVLLEHKVVAKQLVTIERNLRKNSTLVTQLWQARKTLYSRVMFAIVKLQ